MKLLNKKIYTTGSIKLFDWWRASGHPRSVHKDANINKVEDLALSQENKPRTGWPQFGKKKNSRTFQGP